MGQSTSLSPARIARLLISATSSLHVWVGTEGEIDVVRRLDLLLYEGASQKLRQVASHLRRERELAVREGACP